MRETKGKFVTQSSNNLKKKLESMNELNEREKGELNKKRKKEQMHDGLVLPILCGETGL